MLITKLERRFEDAAVSLPVGFEKGQVFTPRFLATWGAVLLKEHLGETWSGNLLDPACGDGELLDAALEQLPNAKLFGMDIDCEASQAAQTRLGTSAIIKTEDMLLSPALISVSRASR
ncbi:SAM-dependent methyltransferase (plasmid) [Rhodobacteraceae bacterium S2214]|nr:SAM-dependent methyltransferase [Rhodobacteraceae bacterium S2214]